MAKARQRKIRNSGLIPERRHDAFLLALLLALFLNISFFAVQALLPRLAYLLQLLGPAAEEQLEPDIEAFPFTLISPDMLDEEILSQTMPQALSTIDREARQDEAAEELPFDRAYVPDGVEELLTPLEGESGPADSGIAQPESAPSEDQPEADPAPEEERPEEEPVEPTDEPDGEEMPPEDPVPPAPEPLPEPMPEPEPLPEPPPPVEPVEPIEPLPEPVPPEPEPPEPEPLPDPEPEVIDLAALPTTDDGYMDQERQYLEEVARREELARQERRERERILEQQRQREYEEYQRRLEQERLLELQRQEYERRLQEQRQFEEFQRQQEIQRQLQEQQQQQEPRERPQREGRRQPTFKKIGQQPSEASRESRPSTPGGAPRQRNQASRVNLLDSDPNMKVLAHRYGEYMKKLAEQLQQSLNREVILNPTYYTRGQAKIFFTITADGRLGYYDTQYPADGELDYVRITSERTLINAVPFDPPTRQMLEDPLFRRMSLTVNLY